MATLDLADSAVDNPLPYDLPAHPLAQDGRYDTAILREPLRELPRGMPTVSAHSGR